MSFSAEDYEVEEVSSLERRPPMWDRDRIWIRNAIIEEIIEERDVWYVTVRYNNQNQGRDWDRGPDWNRGRDGNRGPDWDRGPDGNRGPDWDRGPDGNRGPDRDRDRDRNMQRIRLVVGRQTRIIDRNGREAPPRRLREGMRIDALISAAMTRSIPPQARAFQIVILEGAQNSDVTVGRIIQVNPANQFIVVISERNPNNIIRFNVGPETLILGPNENRIPFRNLFPGLRVRVEHGSFFTASIPPQTPAFVIRVIR